MATILDSQPLEETRMVFGKWLNYGEKFIGERGGVSESYTGLPEKSQLRDIW